MGVVIKQMIRKDAGHSHFKKSSGYRIFALWKEFILFPFAPKIHCIGQRNVGITSSYKSIRHIIKVVVCKLFSNFLLAMIGFVKFFVCYDFAYCVWQLKDVTLTYNFT